MKNKNIQETLEETLDKSLDIYYNYSKDIRDKYCSDPYFIMAGDLEIKVDKILQPIRASISESIYGII